MQKILLFLLATCALAGCNSVYVKPNTLNTDEVFYVDAGGSLMQQGTKEALVKRGYKTTVGHKRASISSTYITAEGAESKISETAIGKARYIVYVAESTSKFRPIWCALNGFWWLRFNISIADNNTGEELLHWTGRGCANSSLRLLNNILDKMEQ